MRNFDSFSRFSVSASVIAIGAAFASPAFAQTPPAPSTPPNCQAIQDEAQRQACVNAASQADPLANTGEASTTASGAGSADSTQAGKGAIVVTGSRLRRDERTSADPLTVIDPNVENREGKLNTAQVLQTSPLAAGSTQITSTISSNFVVNGGEGVETISLRGLGANRTLVLLNGRRAGPAGVRGGVSAFDLNVIPIEAIQQIDILKTGASSIYGSDAIAGVVNLITKKDLRGLQLRGFASVPTTAGGDEKSLSILGGFGIGDRGHVMIGAEWYKRSALARGDRSFLGCEEENVTSEATGARADPIDPRTGNPYCGTFANSQIFLTDFFGAPNLCGPIVPERPIPPFPATSHTGCGPLSSRPPGFTRRPITSIQFNYPGTRLNEFLSPLAPAGADFRNLTAPAGFFPVGFYNAAGAALANNYNSQLDRDSVIPRTKRYTIFGEAGYDLTDDINLYFEGLYNRRKTHTVAHRQLFFYQFAGDSVIGLPFYFCEGGVGTEQCDPFAAGDPLNTGFTFPGLLTPVIIAPFDSGTDVKYFRGLAGARADLSKWLTSSSATQSNSALRRGARTSAPAPSLRFAACRASTSTTPTRESCGASSPTPSAHSCLGSTRATPSTTRAPPSCRSAATCSTCPADRSSSRSAGNGAGIRSTTFRVKPPSRAICGAARRPESPRVGSGQPSCSASSSCRCCATGRWSMS